MIIEELLEDIKDPRRQSGRYTYVFSDLLIMALTAILAGANDWEEIADWVDAELGWFNNYLGANYKKAPSHDTFNRVLSVIKKVEFERMIKNLMTKLAPLSSGQIALDGKTTKGSARGGENGIHTINAYALESGFAIAAQSCEGRGHEIKGIKDILIQIELNSKLISIDAIGCQAEICEYIIKNKGDYLLAVKKNQKNLYEAIEYEFLLRKDSKEILGELEKRRQQIQQNRYLFLDANLPKELQQRWSHIKTIIKEEKISEDKVISTRYFISSEHDINYLSKAIRNHWAIENNLHWSLDVCFKEDQNRSYKNNSAHNFGILRKIAYNAVKMIQKPKDSLKKTRLQIDKKIDVREDILLKLGF
jgi:predicted transposase YbfD/YdcC